MCQSRNSNRTHARSEFTCLCYLLAVCACESKLDRTEHIPHLLCVCLCVCLFKRMHKGKGSEVKHTSVLHKYSPPPRWEMVRIIGEAPWSLNSDGSRQSCLSILPPLADGLCTGHSDGLPMVCTLSVRSYALRGMRSSTTTVALLHT